MFFVVIEWLRGWLMPPPFWLNDLGKRGEYLVRRRFHRRGYHCVARNWRHHKGEIDLVMANFRNLVFLEVKTRTWRKGLMPDEVIAHEQAVRLKALAGVFLARWQEQNIPWRFQLVLVSLKDGSFQFCETDLPA